MDPGDAGPFQDLCVWNLVLPLNIEGSADAAQVELVELFGVSAVDSPGLAGVEESGEYNCRVDLELDGKAKFSPLPDVLSESPKGSAGLGNPAVNFCHCSPLLRVCYRGSTHRRPCPDRRRSRRGRSALLGGFPGVDVLQISCRQSHALHRSHTDFLEGDCAHGVAEGD